jgi:GH24 family phage-related lysozyme (muramidase)
LDSKGENFLKYEIEKLRLKPYDDRTGKEITEWNERATIGYGHLIAKEDWDTYKNGLKDEAAAEALFDSDLAPWVKVVNDGLEVNVAQDQFNALVYLTFNIGNRFTTSSVRKMINDPNTKTDYSTLESAWKAYDGPGKASEPGLVNRRACEWKIYSKGVYEPW